MEKAQITVAKSPTERADGDEGTLFHRAGSQSRILELKSAFNAGKAVAWVSYRCACFSAEVIERVLPKHTCASALLVKV